MTDDDTLEPVSAIIDANDPPERQLISLLHQIMPNAIETVGAEPHHVISALNAMLANAIAYYAIEGKEQDLLDRIIEVLRNGFPALVVAMRAKVAEEGIIKIAEDDDPLVMSHPSIVIVPGNDTMN